ncbi:FIST N-terminal domain-containing protein [uncultured Treponema sp.]|uniref:FIST signal transduction protein n=1 Tax=uncultured Treponema sp. TaxID=162155 RepID=UPI0025E4F8DA|nr:FIST N-terminal domain-containing protein [uncultured Treponema sp.]
MKQEIVFSGQADAESAVQELVRKLKNPPERYNAVLFFASSDYDFEILSTLLHEKFSGAQVVGTTTSGEISRQGFTSRSIVLTALSCDRTKFSGVVFDGVDKFPIVHKKELEDAAAKIGIRCADSTSHRNAFAITFVNGLCNAEEALLSFFYAVIKNDDFMIAGGSAGDYLKFKRTFVSCNGKVVSDGAAILFVKTPLPFFIQKENIFKPSGKRTKITQADTYIRKIISLDGINPRRRYAELLGIPESKADSAALTNPFGRVFGGHTFISSIAGFNPDGTINMYSRVLANSTVELMELVPIREKIEESLNSALKEIPHPGCIILVNCILRTIIFQQQGICDQICRLYDSHGLDFAGFSSYGEQIGRINSNQTLVSIIIGE